jgi:hypothetical protein
MLTPLALPLWKNGLTPHSIGANDRFKESSLITNTIFTKIKNKLIKINLLSVLNCTHRPLKSGAVVPVKSQKLMQVKIKICLLIDFPR